MITGWLRSFAGHGVRIVRLDAVGYVIKKAGTSCFMVEPEIYAFLDWIVGVADSLGLVLLPEVHDQYATHEALARHGYWTYDFVLPGLLLHAFATGSATRLGEHLARSPERQFTMLDCHDGIPVRPDLDGILSQDEMLDLADLVQRRGGNVNRILSEAHADGDVDVHQLNCTYYSALDCDDDRYVAARAIQLFARGVPQIYYVGLLAGENDHAAVAESGEGRAINRHNYYRQGRSTWLSTAGSCNASSTWSGCGVPIRHFQGNAGRQQPNPVERPHDMDGGRVTAFKVSCFVTRCGAFPDRTPFS